MSGPPDASLLERVVPPWWMPPNKIRKVRWREADSAFSAPQAGGVFFQCRDDLELEFMVHVSLGHYLDLGNAKMLEGIAGIGQMHASARFSIETTQKAHNL